MRGPRKYFDLELHFVRLTIPFNHKRFLPKLHVAAEGDVGEAETLNLIGSVVVDVNDFAGIACP